MDISAFASIALGIGVRGQEEMDAVWAVAQTYPEPTTPSEVVETIVRAYTEVHQPPVVIDESVPE